ncbi:MAG: hypothetical protein K2O10_05435, partial [Muribaculaceae bacterium]|nr:hypothetical protein [Muribaculaceae bacterium]
MDYRILPPDELIDNARVTMPLSKSVANRALVMAALTGNSATPAALPDCDDTRLLAQALQALASTDSHVELNLDNAGTAMRFLAAYIAATPGKKATLTGSPRMLQRPLAPLVAALRECGADIEYLGAEGYPPIKINGRELDGGHITVDATISSQFISALLMVAPTMTRGLTVDLDGAPASAPYITLTLDMMSRRGITADRSPLTISVPNARYTPTDTDDAEGDWSAAAFFYALTAISAGWITLEGLDPASAQGDRAVVELFGRLGVVTEPSEEVPQALDLQPSPEIFGRIEADLADTPDLAPALVVACCTLSVPFRLTGLKSLAIKECDRLDALCREMAKIGCHLEKIRDFGLEWQGRRMPVTSLPEFDTHGDHRLAMALAPMAVLLPGIKIRDAGCGSKSYPAYWDALRDMGFTTADPATDTADDDSSLPPET